MADIKSLAFTRRITNKEKEYDENDERIIDTVQRILANKNLNGIIISSDASHYGIVNENYRLYTIESGKKAYQTFYKPVAKPMLKMHDPWSDPPGRVYDAMVIEGSFRTNGQTAIGLLKTGSFITDPNTIERIKDGRYVTLSTGFSASSKRCSICGFDWYQYELNPEKYRAERGEMCEHQDGKIYNKKLSYLEVDVARYNELSIVEGPAHDSAVIKAYTETIMKDFAGTESQRNIIDYDFVKRHLIDVSCNDTSGLYYTVDDSMYKSRYVQGITLKENVRDSTELQKQQSNEDKNSQSGAKRMEKELEDYLKGLAAKIDETQKAILEISRHSGNTDSQSSKTQNNMTDVEAETIAIEKVTSIVKDYVESATARIIEALKSKENVGETDVAQQKTSDNGKNTADVGTQTDNDMIDTIKVHTVLSNIESALKDISQRLSTKADASTDQTQNGPVYRPKNRFHR
jgi:hypothetical protein